MSKLMDVDVGMLDVDEDVQDIRYLLVDGMDIQQQSFLSLKKVFFRMSR